MTTARQQVQEPSIQAALFQCRSLLAHLSEYCEPEYPSNATRIRDLLAVLAERVEERLWAIHGQRQRDDQGRVNQPLGEAQAQNVIQLGEAVQTIHACLRYIESSKPPATPPEIQTAITALVSRHVPRALGCAADEVLVLVRPQWAYSLKYVGLLEHLQREIEFSLLDPDGEFSTESFRSFLEDLWRVRRPDKLPKHVAVISFAGLDGHDALLYPLLTHEVSHLIDFGYHGTLHSNPELQPQAYVVSTDDIRQVFDPFHPPVPPSAAWEPVRTAAIDRHRNRVNGHIQICMREITADLLAIRMLGLPYFVATAEYLKYVSPWPQEITDENTGYPGMAYRLQLAFEELTHAEAGLDTLGQLQRVLEGATGAARAAIQRGIDYLKEWDTRFAGLQRPTVGFRTLETALARLVQERVERMLQALRRLVRRVIPQEQLPEMPTHLGDLITLLERRVPPAQPLLDRARLNEGLPDTSFGDVLTAGWLYELAHGEDAEDACSSAEGAHREYNNTCQLLFKAIELHGARQAILALDEHAFDSVAQLDVTEGSTSPGAVSAPSLAAALSHEDGNRRLFLTPYYGPRPINAATLDIRLGNWFRIARRTRSTCIDLTDREHLRRVRQEQQSEVYVPFGDTFTLHPGDFALAISLEYFALPPDLVAFVEG